MLILCTDVEHFYQWQSRTFAAHGAKGTHIGSHATLYVDLLLRDMKVTTGHLDGWRRNPVKLLQQWFRPMYPQIYKNLVEDRKTWDQGGFTRGEKQLRSLDILGYLSGTGVFLPLLGMLVATWVLRTLDSE